jgi:FlaA1/EpsC-like NDP-sugar epimerase
MAYWKIIVFKKNKLLSCYGMIAADFVAATLSLVAAHNYGAESILSNELAFLNLGFITLLPVLFYFSKIYNMPNGYLSIKKILKIVKVIILFEVIFLIALFLFRKQHLFAIFFLSSIFVLNICIGVRALLSILASKIQYGYMTSRAEKNILIYGAGDAGMQLSNSFADASQINIRGYLDDNVLLHGKTLNGVKIYGPDQISALVGELCIDEIYLAIPSASNEKFHAIVTSLGKLQIKIRTLPKLKNIVNGRVGLNDIRSIEIEDLLLRPPVLPNKLLMGMHISNKVILVTGAGGSIGSEICRQISDLNPKRLILVEHSEFNLYTIHRELLLLASIHAEANFEVIPMLVSVTDYEKLHKAMQFWMPDIVFHAAAYKHVSIVESNLASGLKNNIWGTINAAQSAYKAGVKNFILISTDKAVRPTSAMGASKRIAELVLQAFASENHMMSQGHNTCFSIVRFGNVLGSSGSVVPLFQKQIKSGGPVTLRHKDITRFFMTIEEAAQLVIQSSSLSKGGDIFLLDMGQPIKIYDLAKKMIELSGFELKCEENPYGDIEIVVTGLEAGEKLYEEMLISRGALETSHPKILRAVEDGMDWIELSDGLIKLENAIEEYNIENIYKTLTDLVRGYSHSQLWVDHFFRKSIQQ